MSGLVVEFTYTSAKGGFMDRSLRIEMRWPDSINDIDIETFSMTGKQMEIADNNTAGYKKGRTIL
jgi:hypothetical protein